MKYIKAIDVWAYGEAIRTGQIKLQSGQWIKLGNDGQLSRFHSTNGKSITAFHGHDKGIATNKYMSYVKGISEHRAMVAINRANRIKSESI